MQPRQRATFDPTDLAVVLSHFDLGVIESITELPRGARRSAKVGVVCERGKFLLKQRLFSRARPERVAVSHRVQSHLGSVGFPLPKLIPPRGGRTTWVVHRDHTYELFEFVSGQHYSRRAMEARDAGATLAWFHQATRDFNASTAAPLVTGNFHDAPGIRVGLCSIGSTLSSHESFSGDEAELAGLVAFLLEAYESAAEAVNGLGFAGWPRSVCHADWHPGNLLFREGKVVGVVDYDSVRSSAVVTDVANGALHFSLIAGEDPSTWPDHLDEELLKQFMEGYLERCPLDSGKLKCIGHLMAEALIAECVSPINETGSVGRWSGFRVLQMVRRKVTWLRSHQDRLFSALR